MEDLQSKRVSGRRWTEIGDLDPSLAGLTVLVRGSAQASRPVGKKMVFLVVRQFMSTVQCLLTADQVHVSTQMAGFAKGLSRESVVDVEGVVSIPKESIRGPRHARIRVEIQVRKLYCINRAVPNLPINIENAAWSETEIAKAEMDGEKLVRVGQDTRLNYRVLDLRTPANLAIFSVQYKVEYAGMIIQQWNNDNVVETSDLTLALF
ncbi:aspartate--tRNA ligase 2, cytoplasmic-like [Iris pallida]|uniref:Aspartate--tRNA ligase 2, cytoplasmic-like n=1 Tax=Iris pallida TaxID=29817 RepID=A0AAX6DTF7_IRIPA|nr:aspartate--tRNA ligase 2, cytoplasmic-like [Iris pallida]